MRARFCILGVGLALTLSTACQDQTTPDKPAQQAKTGDPAAKGAPVGEADAPQNPHAMPKHLGPKHPAVGKPAGPPRDITPSGELREELVEELKLMVPKEWERGSGSNTMRKAEFTLPGPGGDVSFVVYRFASQGSASMNIDRWKGQVTLADGSEAETQELEAGGLKISAVDLRGKYAGQSMPGAPPQPPIDDARMFAAALTGPGDPFYFKIVGPSATVDLWAPAWTKLLEGLSVASAPTPTPEGAEAEGAEQGEQPDAPAAG